MFPFEPYDHGVICSVSVDIFMDGTGYECLHHCRLRMSVRRSKINAVPFHIKVCSCFLLLLSREATQQCENVKSRSHKAG